MPLTRETVTLFLVLLIGLLVAVSLRRLLLSRSLESRLERALDEHERILWTACPPRSPSRVITILGGLAFFILGIPAVLSILAIAGLIVCEAVRAFAALGTIPTGALIANDDAAWVLLGSAFFLGAFAVPAVGRWVAESTARRAEWLYVITAPALPSSTPGAAPLVTPNTEGSARVSRREREH